MPWSVRLVLVLVLASAGALAWSKRPFVSDAEKVCNVAKLSACAEPEVSLVGNECKIVWLERSMWSFGRLAQMPRADGPGGGEFLRALARKNGLAACPEAEVVDRERESRRQQAEAAQRAAEEPEPESTPGDAASGPPERRATGIVTSQAPAVDGEMDPALISKEVRYRLGAIKACYQRALRRKPDLAGMVKVRWTITPAGTVSGVEVEEDGMGDAEVASCIKGLVRRWRFVAPSSGSVDVVYPFMFRTSKAVAP
jgi:TonB family protein